MTGFYILINIVDEETEKRTHHPSKVQTMNCFTAKACCQWLPLLSITLQVYTSFRHLTLHSVHCQPPASATRARVLPFIPLRSCPPSVSFRSPFGFPILLSGTQSQNGKLHSTQPNSLLCIQSPPLLYPTLTSACPAVEFAQENQRAQNSAYSQTEQMR